jgi:hypothetical protein
LVTTTVPTPQASALSMASRIAWGPMVSPRPRSLSTVAAAGASRITFISGAGLIEPSFIAAT